jgi:hypothetical protein
MIIKAKSPVFQGLSDPLLRALVVVGRAAIRVEFVKPQLPPQSPYKTEPALKVSVLLPAEIHR